MKLLATPKYLSDAVAPLMILNYLMGLRIFKYSCGKLRIALGLMYLLFLLTIHCVSAYMEYKSFKNVQLLKLEYVLFDVMVYINAVVVVYEMILGSFYTKQLNDCYRRVAQIDETLRKLGSIFNYRRIYFSTIGAIIFLFSYIFITSILTIVHMHRDPPTTTWLIVSHIYGINISTIINSEFSIFVKCLEMKFKLINELLSEGAAVTSKEKIKLNPFAAEDNSKKTDVKQRRHILSIKVLSELNQQLQSRIRTSASRKRGLVKSRPRSHFPFQHGKNFQTKLQCRSKNQHEDSNCDRKSIMVAECDQKRKHLLQTIRQVHLELCRVTKTLCTSFGIQITSEIGISVMLISGFSYNIYTSLAQQQYYIGYSLMDQVLILMMLTTVSALKVVVINRVCKKATNEGKKTNEIIHTIYGCSADVDIREEILQFGLQISQSPVEFSAFGVSLNYNVLSSCLKTVTTYVVIMIQMGNSLESSKNIGNNLESN